MTSSKRVVLGASMVAALIVSATATAAKPEITRFFFDDHYVDTQTCPGIPIDTHLEGHISVTVLSSTRVQVHQHLVYRATGNGKSVTDNESFTEFANPETGVSRFAGTTINIQVPHHGKLLVDANGMITIDFTTDPWTVLPRGRPAPTLPRWLRPTLRLSVELAHTPSSRGWSLRRHPGGFASAEGG